ncbi:MAG: hypothetical protein EA383_07055 [Spirochaetaceae bacterium]|nr:MAG: hypothetical protein EA383_07055 [Spirochaetaceae bacterium]
MTVLVNNEKVDVTLENEHTVGDVVRELAGWLRDQGMELHAISLDDKKVALDETVGWHDRAVDSVETIALDAMMHPSRDPETLMILLELLGLIERNIEQGNRDNLVEAMREYEYARPTLARALNASADTGVPALSILDDLAAKVKNDPDVFTSDNDAARRTVTAASAVVLELAGRLSEFQNPEQQLNITREALRAQIAELSDIAVMLQQGRDADAMKQLLKFTELVEKLIRLGAWSHGEGSELNTFFGELIQAFEAEDTVLIGDLVEYEILPRIEALLDSDDAGS